VIKVSHAEAVQGAHLASGIEDDPLDELFNSPGAQPARPRPEPPASYQPRDYTEPCDKCGGTGNWRPGYPCFSCKGKGRKTFKAPAAARAKAREQAVERKLRKAAEAIAAFQQEEPEIFAWMNEEGQKANPFPFAVSMQEALAKYGYLTEGQLAACRRCVDGRKRAQAAREERTALAPTVDTSKIEQAFATARARAMLKNPNATGVMVKPLRMTSGDVSIKVTPGSTGSQWEGMLFVKRVEDDRKLGFVKNGKFQARFECTDAEEAAVLDCAANPAVAAVAFGQAWKLCGVCNRTLTDPESIARGIGPICAEKFGF
jgi:hypothetical protein